MTEAARRSHSAILSMQMQVRHANSEVKDALDEIRSTMPRIQAEVVDELCSTFKQRALTEITEREAESKCQRADEVEELALQHGNQVKHVSSLFVGITGLSQSPISPLKCTLTLSLHDRSNVK